MVNTPGLPHSSSRRPRRQMHRARGTDLAFLARHLVDGGAGALEHGAVEGHDVVTQGPGRARQRSACKIVFSKHTDRASAVVPGPGCALLESHDMPAPRAPSELAPRRAASPFTLPRLLLALTAIGCANPGEPPACLDQRQEARNLALRGEVEAAQAVLDRVKASCGPNSQSDIAHITKLIAEKTAARLEKQHQAELERERLETNPSRGFVEWATARGGEIDGKLAKTECAARGTPDFGFCEGQREQAPAMSLRYWQAQPSAYRYALTTRTAPSCQDLGEFRQVRTWSRPGERFELCELTNRRLRHLFALIVQKPAEPAPEYQMFLFSQDYLAIDPAFERRLRIIGEP